MDTCQFCGNDDATYHVCLDCLTPTRQEMARALAVVLGGDPGQWDDVAGSVVNALS